MTAPVLPPADRDEPLAIVLDDYALAVVPGLDADLARAGALVMRSFRSVPGPHLLRGRRGAAVVGGEDRAGVRARLERATAALSSPVIAVLPAGVAPAPDLRGAGVVDLVPAGARAVAQRVLLMACVPVVGPRRSDSAPPPGKASAGAPARRAAAGDAADGPAGSVVAIASSTGGAWVLADVLRGLAPRGRAALVAQHMEAEFVAFFADWLHGASGWRTVVVSGLVPLSPGVAYVPAGGHDLVLEPGGVRALPASGRFVPSGDRLLASAALLGPHATGVVLSGMGSDGAEGLAALSGRGGRAFCQEPGSAVVPSMPESALRGAPGAVAVVPEGLAAAIAGHRSP